MTDAGIDIPLSDLIDAVRGELEKAAKQAEGRDLLFEVNDVELDLEIATTGTKEAGGGLKVWVVSIGGKGSKSSASAREVECSLAAVTKTGTKFRTSDRTTAPVSPT